METYVWCYYKMHVYNLGDRNVATTPLKTDRWLQWTDLSLFFMLFESFLS